MSQTKARVVFTLITFCIIWKDTIFSVISILNFLKSTSRQIFTKTKRLNGSKTIVFDFNIIFVFINVWLPLLLKKFNMDITEKMVSFQIIQNVLILKRTLIVNKKTEIKTKNRNSENVWKILYCCYEFKNFPLIFTISKNCQKLLKNASSKA